MLLIWTEDDGRVGRIHHKPSILTEEQKQGSIEVDAIPEEPDKSLPEEERYVLYYTDSSGVHYKTISTQ